MAKMLDPKEEAVLTMVRQVPDGNKIRLAYEKLMSIKSEAMGGKMCWPVEWFPEPLPIESSSGNALYAGLEYMANPTGCIDGQWPPVDMGCDEKEDILLFTDSYGYCKEMIDQAPPGRIGILNVQNKPPGSYDEKGLKQLVKAHKWDMIIFAFGMDPPASNSVEDIHAAQNDVLKVYLYLLKAIGDTEGQVKKMAVLSVDCFADEKEIHEDQGIGLITHSTLFGMTNTARSEIPFCPFQFIDTEWALRSENVKFLAAEIFRKQSFGHNSVRILNKGRYVLRAIDASNYEYLPDMQMPKAGCIGITGGNGALGLVMGIWLLQKAKEQGGKKFSIKFLSRSATVNEQNTPNWELVQSMAKDLGIEVKQDTLDFSKRPDVDRWIEENTPNLCGIIHSAGVLQDSMLFNMTWEKFETSFNPKSRAALYIHDALERFENPIEFFWVFSSGAVYGNMGQLNYSASNSFLDGLVRHRRAMGKPAMAPQWGAWGDVGMAKNLDDASRRRMANGPFPYFTNAEGLHGMEQLIRSGFAYGQVMKCNPPVVFGMVMGDDIAQQCYMRNFYSQLAPPPPGDPNKNIYTTYAYEYRKIGQQQANGLVMQNFHPKIAEEMAE